MHQTSAIWYSWWPCTIGLIDLLSCRRWAVSGSPSVFSGLISGFWLGYDAAFHSATVQTHNRIVTKLEKEAISQNFGIQIALNFEVLLRLLGK